MRSPRHICATVGQDRRPANVRTNQSRQRCKGDVGDRGNVANAENSRGHPASRDRLLGLDHFTGCPGPELSGTRSKPMKLFLDGKPNPVRYAFATGAIASGRLLALHTTIRIRLVTP